MSILNVDTIQPVSTGTTVTVSNGDLVVGTGLTIGRSGVITATSFSGSGANLTALSSSNLSGALPAISAANLTSIPGANITGTIPAAALTNVDLSGLKKDIATLALQTAVDTNRAAYNLTDSFIDQYETDVGIAHSTNTFRNTDEYFATIANVETDFAPPLKTARSNPVGTVFTRTGSSVANDTYELDFNGGGDPNYPGCYIDHLWDLSSDWTCKLFYNTTNGSQHSRKYGGFSLLITTDTSKAAGSSPTGVFNAPQSNGNGVNVNSVADWGNNRHLTTAYGTTALGVENYAETNSTGSGDVSVDCNSTNHNIRAYENSNSQEYGGLVIQHVSSTNTITTKWLNPNSRTTFHTNNEITITEVPSSGRAIIYKGTGDPLNNLYVSTTYASSSASDWSKHYVTQANATGICTSKQNTVTGARTKVSGVMLYKNGAGTATLGTDLKVSFTCNGGTNWTQVGTYTTGSNFSTGIETIYLGETTCTSGTDVRYKVEWANQALGSKETQLHGMALNY